MADSYRPVVRDQPVLLPPDMREWLPADHLVWFVLEALAQVDTSVFHARHVRARREAGGRGRAAYDPDMLLALLIYAYARGIRSSRAIERLCQVDVAFRVVCAGDGPDHVTIARFRAEHQDGFAGVFAQVLRIVGRAGLARFGTVAIDGTKIAADASLGANRDPDWVRAEVDRIVAEAAAADAAEDAAHGPGRRGDEPPPDLRDPRSRAARLVAAAAELRAEQARRQAERQAEQAAQQAEHAGAAADRLQRLADDQVVSGRAPAWADRIAEAEARLERNRRAQQAKIDRWQQRTAESGRPPGPAPSPVEEYIWVRRAKAALERARQRARERAERAARRADQAGPRVVNTTDPQSRVMPTRNGWVQGYNVQVAVTADQIIAAVDVGQNPADVEQFVPMLDAAVDTADGLFTQTGRAEHRVGTVLADAGYASDANLTAPGPDRLIALGNRRSLARHAREHPAVGDPPEDATPRQAMDHRLRTAAGSALYKRRGATVEPGIGNLKKILPRFSRRGLHAARSEAHLAATAFNLLKIYRAATA